MEVDMRMPDQGSSASVTAFAVGMVTGVVIGFVLWIATDTFALFPAFIGVGLVLGTVLQSAADRPHDD